MIFPLSCDKWRIAIICGLLALCAGAKAAWGGGGWRQVSPEPETGGAIRLHRWHELIADPSEREETVAEVREAMAADRMTRLTGAFDLRGPNNTPALQWAVREAAAAARTTDRLQERDNRSSGLFDGWLSDVVGRQDDDGSRSIWDSTAAGSGSDVRDRNWGWLANDVFERERSAEGRVYGRPARSAFGDDDIDGLGDLPQWHPFSAGQRFGDDRSGPAVPGWR